MDRPALLLIWLECEQVCAWLSGSFVLVSTYYGFGRHTVEIVSQPGGQQTLVKVLFWQIMGYREDHIRQKEMVEEQD